MESLRAAAVALTGIAEALWAAGDTELGALMEALDDIAASASAGRAAVALEARSRGTIASSQLTTDGWIAANAPSLAGRGARPLGSLIDQLHLHSADVAHARVKAALCDGRLDVPTAHRVLSEMHRLRPSLNTERDGVEESAVDAMIVLGAWGPRSVAALRTELLARYGRDGELQRVQDSHHRAVSLSGAVTERDGISTYQLVLDEEGRSVLEAAIGPLSAPQAGPDGAPDLRGARQRRAEALIEVCRRATETSHDKPGGGVKATLILTMDVDHLRTRLDAGRTLGGIDHGTRLAPETVRRLACDARIIPAVLGARGEPLELGRSVRLFSPGQVAALWLRDSGCTFPGCERPPHWCDAHHLRHWADDGRTDLSNAALLCARHHTVVHRDRLQGSLIDGVVVWDCRPGSYDLALAAPVAPAAPYAAHTAPYAPPAAPPAAHTAPPAAPVAPRWPVARSHPARSVGHGVQHDPRADRPDSPSDARHPAAARPRPPDVEPAAPERRLGAVRLVDSSSPPAGQSLPPPRQPHCSPGATLPPLYSADAQPYETGAMAKSDHWWPDDVQASDEAESEWHWHDLDEPAMWPDTG